MSTTDPRQILSQARTIAVLGAHDDPSRPACYVPEYLYSQGYRVLPVNPLLVGRTLWGERVRGTLAELGQAVDIVDVFRRAEFLPAHEADILAMQPRPPVVWLQLGIREAEFARRLEQAGITAVQDRCMLADHKHFAIGRVA
jgi:predicted CoA-binding protein